MLIRITIALLMLFSVACHQKTMSDAHTIKLGTIEGPETILMETAAIVAKQKYGLTVILVPFSDYSLPNVALQEQDIDANAFQHLPYLLAFMQAKKADLAIVGKTFIFPMGLYSRRWKSLPPLPHQATVAIPNDPSNEARALLLLASAGLIQLSTTDPAKISTKTITDNPLALKFVELDAPQLPRALDDVDLAVINTNYAISAGLSPSKDALYKENKSSIYANILVVRKNEVSQKKYQQLLSALHDAAVLNKARALFSNDILFVSLIPNAPLQERVKK